MLKHGAWFIGMSSECRSSELLPLQGDLILKISLFVNCWLNTFFFKVRHEQIQFVRYFCLDSCCGNTGSKGDNIRLTAPLGRTVLK